MVIFSSDADYGSPMFHGFRNLPSILILFFLKVPNIVTIFLKQCVEKQNRGQPTVNYQVSMSSMDWHQQFSHVI